MLDDDETFAEDVPENWLCSYCGELLSEEQIRDEKTHCSEDCFDDDMREARAEDWRDRGMFG